MSASTLWPPLPDPDSKLRRYRRLSPLASVNVSPLQLGGLSIGNVWDMGSGGKEEAFRLLDAFFDAGGNLIDTANMYHGGLSEEWIGEWAEKRGIRNQLVVTTKYTDSPYRWGPEYTKVNNAALWGNSVKSMVSSLEISLKRLRMAYVDIFYVHLYDHSTSIEELMNGLHNLVVQGKVLYLGASNMPAWVVSEANRYAKMSGKTPFVIYQGAWNVFTRDFEREIIPMARAHGLALAPWNIFHQGKVRSDAEEEERRRSGKQGRLGWGDSWERSEDQRKVCKALEKVAVEIGAPNIRAVALAYVMQKTTHVFPIIGVRSVEQLEDNIKALNVCLTQQHLDYIDNILPFNPGPPHELIGDGTKPSACVRSCIVLDWDPLPEPIRGF